MAPKDRNGAFQEERKRPHVFGWSDRSGLHITAEQIGVPYGSLPTKCQHIIVWWWFMRGISSPLPCIMTFQPPREGQASDHGRSDRCDRCDGECRSAPRIQLRYRKVPKGLLRKSENCSGQISVTSQSGQTTRFYRRAHKRNRSARHPAYL